MYIVQPINHAKERVLRFKSKVNTTFYRRIVCAMQIRSVFFSSHIYKCFSFLLRWLMKTNSIRAYFKMLVCAFMRLWQRFERLLFRFCAFFPFLFFGFEFHYLKFCIFTRITYTLISFKFHQKKAKNEISCCILCNFMWFHFICFDKELTFNNQTKKKIKKIKVCKKRPFWEYCATNDKPKY